MKEEVYQEYDIYSYIHSMKLSVPLLIFLTFACNLSFAQEAKPVLRSDHSAVDGNTKDLLAAPFRLVKNNSAAYKKAATRLKGKMGKFSLISLTGNYTSLQKEISNTDHFNLQLPGKEAMGTRVRLQKSQLTAPGFIIRTSDGKTIHNSRAAENNFYGSIENEPRSVAAVSFNRSGIKGIISDASGNNVIEPIPGSKSGEHIFYNEHDVTDKQPFSCQATEDELFKKRFSEQLAIAKPAGNTCKTVKIYIECTYAMYQAHNNNINDVIDFVFGFFNVSAVLFKNDGINIQLSELFIWNQPDIYAGITSPQQLLTLMQNRLKREFDLGHKVNADVAHMVTPQNFSGGASNIGIMNNCGQSNGILASAASSLINPYFQLPAFSKTIYIFTHETGHLLGSPHTQSCTWPGGAIDNCAATEGGCPPGPAPVNGGTIMSYCNLTPYGINFLNGFGPLPSALIRDQIERIPCISLCADTICGNMKLRGVEAIISNSLLKFKWINEAPKYKIGVKPNTTRQWQYYEVINSDSFELAKTNCESLYEYSITPFCASLNKYGTGYGSFVGDTLATRLSFNPLFAGNTICAADSITLSVNPDSNFLFRWYNNDILQPQFVTRIIRTNQIGTYHVTATGNGCDYFSDTVSILRRFQNPRIVPSITGLKVSLNGFSNCSKKRLWDFGDGTQDTAASQIHLYAQKGIYLVTLKVWDALDNMEQVQKQVDLSDEYIDSLDGYTKYGIGNSVKFIPFACRTVAYFNADSLSKNVSAASTYSPSIRYAQNTGNSFFETPATGTIEFKLYPNNGLIKTRANYSDVLTSDTGYVLNVASVIFEQSFSLAFSKWGGMQVAVDSIVLGNIANGIAGPLRLHEWNNIGISYGNQGIRVMLNGQLFATHPHVIADTPSVPLGRFNFGAYLGRISNNPFDPLYVKSFDGAIDLIRFSHKQHDFTFSSGPAWQGKDTVIINKQVCYGDSFLGYTATGTYYRSAVSTAGCDSVTRVNLLVNDLIMIKDSLIHPLDKSKGDIFITNISGAVEPLHYQWSTGDTTRNLKDLVAGRYTLRITDAIGCERTVTYILYQLNSDKDYVVLFPNPVAEANTLTLRTGTAANKKYDCIIYDVLGRKYLEQTIHINAGVMETVIDQRLLKGVYVLHLQNGKEKYSIRFIVE